MLATLAIVGALGAYVLSRPVVRRFSRHPSPEQCLGMLERYAEQEARSRELQPPSPAPEPLGLGSPQVHACVHDLTAAEVDCALHAGWVDELERCLP